MEEFRKIFSESGESLTTKSSTIPRKYTTPHFIETKGILTITYPEFIRQGRIHGNSIGLYEIKNILSDVEINNSDRLKYFETLINIK